MHIQGKKVLIVATNGFEQSELEVPRDRITEHGATVEVASLERGEIRGWDKKDWGRSVKVDLTIGEVNPDEYDAIVLPGGQMNPDTLRAEPEVLRLIRDFYDRGKVVAAICHAPWLLIDNGIARGKKMTSYKSMKTDLINAGAKWEDREVVTDQGLVTSRNPGDLEAFSAKVMEEIAEGRHRRQDAA